MLRYVFVCMFSVLFWSSPVLAEGKGHSCGCAEMNSDEQNLNEESNTSIYDYLTYNNFKNLAGATLVGASFLISAHRFYETGSIKAALISGASLGLVFLCMCNGSIRFGLCPKRASNYVSIVFAVITGMWYLREQNRIVTQD